VFSELNFIHCVCDTNNHDNIGTNPPFSDLHIEKFSLSY